MENRISVTKIEILIIFNKRINMDHVNLTNSFLCEKCVGRNVTASERSC